ncbi:hypothetical protein DI392_04555 [Vibrio albus]|jgi:hypothetical protein|uniref:DNA repair protein n=1 Tax=Vibrio albus TaxID=2200953 RepID=A0A2U3BC82_9VIBR|nr:hypothetical protein [Vibrio albus]PWI34387.1 hypothetical protein DI392_04555 [Vibrio albus]
MNLDFTGYVVTFLSGVGALFLFLQVRAQYRARVDATRRKEKAKLLHNLRVIKELLSAAQKLPFSKPLFICLYRRLLTILTDLVEFEPDNTKLISKIEYVQNKISLIEGGSSPVSKSSFEVPGNELEAIELLKSLKKLRVVVRNGHSKRQINTNMFVHENARLDNYQTRIIIGNLIKRVNYAIERKQMVIAKELLKKGIHYLHARSSSHSMETVVKLIEQLEMMERKLSGEDELQDLLGTTSDYLEDDSTDLDSTLVADSLPHEGETETSHPERAGSVSSV